MRVLLHVVFWLTLTVWIALVVAPGLTGMTAFGVLQDQEVSVARYADFFAGDQEGMSRLTAGLITDPIFRWTSSAQWVLAPLALVVCLIELRTMRWVPGWSRWARVWLVGAAFALVVYHNVVMGPAMQDELDTYREAAAAMDRPTSEAAHERFETMHRDAERLYSARLLLLVGAVAGTAAGAAAGGGRRSRRGT
ncbi:MAG: hypothetical protein VXY94_05125 [Planctomycetota bacterium]|nr:hypothetical protein [Planctomycetota bacterium]MEC8734869.1 hypothetical protein [Planctomycetota bacterium]